MAYSQVRIYTHPEIGLRARDVFLNSGLESWANELASETLLQPSASLTVRPVYQLHWKVTEGPPAYPILCRLLSRPEITWIG